MFLQSRKFNTVYHKIAKKARDKVSRFYDLFCTRTAAAGILAGSAGTTATAAAALSFFLVPDHAPDDPRNNQYQNGNHNHIAHSH